MRPARAVADDAAPAFAYLRRCDEREIDNPDPDDPRRFRYLERMHEVLRLARAVAPPARVAEIGCAQGNVSLLLAEDDYLANANGGLPVRLREQCHCCPAWRRLTRQGQPLPRKTRCYLPCLAAT